jgi:hypothetical protein
MSEFTITAEMWQELMARISVMERVTLPLTPLGPRKGSAEETAEDDKAVEDLVRAFKMKLGSEREPPPPVDRANQVLASGAPIPEDRSHTALKPSGQQQDYVVLTAAERAKGCVRPYRDAYRHLKCGKITTMGRAIAETFARDPYFYTGTFCATCCGHFPIGEDGEFVWCETDGTDGTTRPKVGT